MQRFILIILLVYGIGISAAFAQVGESFQTGHTCSYFGESIPSTVFSFDSDQEAESVINDIVSASGLAKNFLIKAAGVPNASADILGTVRYIFYNQYFIKDMRKKTGTKWGPISIMAHEIGHHLNGHTLDRLGSRPPLELEADFFSGFILQKMGASLDEARIAMELLGSSNASNTHPAKHDRLAAITNGWIKSCGNDSRCQNNQSSSPSTTIPPSPEPPPVTPPRSKSSPSNPREALRSRIACYKVKHPCEDAVYYESRACTNRCDPSSDTNCYGICRSKEEEGQRLCAEESPDC